MWQVRMRILRLESTRLSHPDMAFASIYTRESPLVFNICGVYEFSWVSTVCGVFDVDGIKILVFCEYIRTKRFRNIIMRAITM